jgi:hypothetical protein
MKILIQLFCFAILSTFSPGCKKENKKTTQNQMSFSLNGTPVACDKNFGATYKTTSGPDANITFHAGWGDNALDFQIFTYTTDITPGQYVFAPNKAYAAELWPEGTATTPGIHYSYIAGSFVPFPTIEGSGQITISEINADHISGSFDFTTGVNSATGRSMTVTNGQFYINR